VVRYIHIFYERELLFGFTGLQTLKHGSVYNKVIWVQVLQLFIQRESLLIWFCWYKMIKCYSTVLDFCLTEFVISSYHM